MVGPHSTPGRPDARRDPPVKAGEGVALPWDVRFELVEYRSEESHDVKDVLDYLKDASHVVEDALAVLSALRA